MVELQIGEYCAQGDSDGTEDQLFCSQPYGMFFQVIGFSAGKDNCGGEKGQEEYDQQCLQMRSR